VKTLGEGQANAPIGPGDDVIFDITVINQGAIVADNIAIIDYIPAGFIFDPALNPDWTDNGDGTASDTLSVEEGSLPEEGLEPGQRTTVQIVLTVAPAMFPDYADNGNVSDPDGVMSGDTLVNVAEIASATDTTGVVQDDIDSVADNDPDNEGDVVEDNDENGGGDTDGDGVNDDDEDDSDIAIVVLTSPKETLSSWMKTAIQSQLTSLTPRM